MAQPRVSQIDPSDRTHFTHSNLCTYDIMQAPWASQHWYFHFLKLTQYMKNNKYYMEYIIHIELIIIDYIVI